MSSEELVEINVQIAVTEGRLDAELAKPAPNEKLLVVWGNVLVEQLKIKNILLGSAAGKFAFFFLTQFDVLLTSNC